MDDNSRKRIAINKDAGELMIALGFDPAKVRRVIIDIAYNEAIMVYTEQFVDKGHFEVATELLNDLSLKVIKVKNA